MSVLTETLVAPLALAVNSSCWTISTENFAGPPPEAVAEELAVVVVVHWIFAAGGPSADEEEEECCCCCCCWDPFIPGSLPPPSPLSSSGRFPYLFYIKSYSHLNLM